MNEFTGEIITDVMGYQLVTEAHARQTIAAYNCMMGDAGIEINEIMILHVICNRMYRRSVRLVDGDSIYVYHNDRKCYDYMISPIVTNEITNNKFMIIFSLFEDVERFDATVKLYNLLITMDGGNNLQLRQDIRGLVQKAVHPEEFGEGGLSLALSLV